MKEKVNSMNEIITWVMDKARANENTNKLASFTDAKTGQQFYVLTRYQMEKLGEGKIS